LNHRDSELSTRTELYESKWATILTLLSMDEVSLYWRLMGLRISDPRQLISTLRETIKKIIVEMKTNPDGKDKLTADWFLERITEVCGKSVSVRVQMWGDNVFDFTLDDHRGLDAWINLFRYQINNKKLWNLLTESIRADIANEFQRTLDMSEYRLVKRSQDDRSLSEWDNYMYAANGYGVSDESNPNGPETFIQPTIKTFKGYSFLLCMKTRLSAEESNWLYINASEIASIESNRSLMFPLPDFRTLVISFEPLSSDKSPA